MKQDAVARIFAGQVLTPMKEEASMRTSSTGLDAAQTIKQIPVELLKDFPKQPFRPYTAEQLEQLRDSITRYGILTPIIVRPWEGGYQIISGHNRRTAAQMAGYTQVPCLVRDLDDDEAIVVVIETNLRQRETLLPSEKAWAYRLELEAIKRQGERTDLTSSQFAAKLRSDDSVGQGSQISGDTVQRYIRLTYLDPILLAAVDERRLGLGVGATLSYLSTKSQVTVYNFFVAAHKLKIDQRLADALRELSEEQLTEEQLLLFLSPSVRPLKRVSVSMRPIRRFFPAEASPKDIEKKILSILAEYFKKEGAK